jgi:putative ABC transport system substrate-binding protein
MNKNRVRRILTIKRIITLLIVCASGAFAGQGRIAIVKSGAAAPYAAAIDGLRAELAKAGVSAYIDEYDIPFQFPDSAQPQVIVAVGYKALKQLATTTTITPVVYMMVNKQPHTQTNITGISLDISPRQQFNLCKKLLPKLRCVGVLYDPGQTRALVEEGITQAREMNIEVIASEVTKLEDIYGALRSLEQRVDALWMIPDATIYNPKTTEEILLYTLKERIPSIGLSFPYVKAGALCSSSCNYNAMGAQTAKMVEKILNGQPPSEIAPQEPASSEISINLITAEHVGIIVPDSVAREATNIVK